MAENTDKNIEALQELLQGRETTEQHAKFLLELHERMPSLTTNLAEIAGHMLALQEVVDAMFESILKVGEALAEDTEDPTN